MRSMPPSSAPKLPTQPISSRLVARSNWKVVNGLLQLQRDRLHAGPRGIAVHQRVGARVHDRHQRGVGGAVAVVAIRRAPARRTATARPSSGGPSRDCRRRPRRPASEIVPVCAPVAGFTIQRSVSSKRVTYALVGEANAMSCGLEPLPTLNWRQRGVRRGIHHLDVVAAESVHHVQQAAVPAQRRVAVDRDATSQCAVRGERSCDAQAPGRVVGLEHERAASARRGRVTRRTASSRRAASTRRAARRMDGTPRGVTVVRIRCGPGARRRRRTRCGREAGSRRRRSRARRRGCGPRRSTRSGPHARDERRAGDRAARAAAGS